MRRTGRGDVLALGESLSARERELVLSVARFKLMGHRQLAVLLGLGERELGAASAARTSRRVLARLAETGLLGRISRRVGGVRAGSAGYVYYLGPAGQRLVALWEGRGLVRGRWRPEPGLRYVRHRLAVSDLYVQARSAAAAGGLELLAFDAEPDCWRTFTDRVGGRAVLKPDAYVRVGVGAYEDSFFVEVDLGSESRQVIARKTAAYLDYFHTGTEQAARGVFPRVLLLTDSQAREHGLAEVCGRLPVEQRRLFSVARLEQAIEVLSGEVEQAADEHQGDGSDELV